MARKRESLSAHHAQQRALQVNGKVCIGNAVLNMMKVQHIKQMLLAGYTRQECADLYLVGKETIARIDRGESWAHVRVEGEPQRPVVNVELPAEPLVERPVASEAAAASLLRLQESLKGAGAATVYYKGNEKAEEEKQNAARALAAFTPTGGEDPNETAKRVLLGAVGLAAEDLGAADTPVNLDELP